MSCWIPADDDVRTAVAAFAAAEGVSGLTVLRRRLGLPDERDSVIGRRGSLLPWVVDGRLHIGQPIYLGRHGGNVRSDCNLVVLGVGNFGSLSAAARGIVGYGCSGPAKWRTAAGEPLTEL